MTGTNYTSSKPKVVFYFNMHAREWISGMAGLYFVQEACSKVAADPTWLSGMEVVAIPMVNPDGFKFSTTQDRFWRKNRRNNAGSSCMGVDLNRNWPKDWGGSSS